MKRCVFNEGRENKQGWRITISLWFGNGRQSLGLPVFIHIWTLMASLLKFIYMPRVKIVRTGKRQISHRLGRLLYIQSNGDSGSLAGRMTSSQRCHYNNKHRVIEAQWSSEVSHPCCMVSTHVLSSPPWVLEGKRVRCHTRLTLSVVQDQPLNPQDSCSPYW